MHATMMMTDPDKRLSPHAPPFHPTGEPVNLCIFNDGIPSFVMPDQDALVHGIQDDALDEGFPPDAQEAAELEAVQIFVETLAALSLLEEREEAARNSFAGVTKRWESRRAEGLIGKPYPARHLVDPTLHLPRNSTGGGSSNATAKTGSIVSYQHAHKQHMMDSRMKTKEVTRRSEPRSMGKKMNKAANQRLPIQQPRKQN